MGRARRRRARLGLALQRKPAQRLLGARQLGRVGQADHRHFRRGERTRTILDILDAFEQHLPGARQRPHPEPLGELGAAPPLEFADRRVFKRRGSDFYPRDEMAKLGKLDQHFRRVGAGLVQPVDEVERLAHLAAHGELEEVDDVAAVGEAEHGAQVVDLDRLAGRVRDRLVEQRQRVAHRALGDARNQRQRIGLRRNLLQAADLGEVLDHQRRNRSA